MNDCDHRNTMKRLDLTGPEAKPHGRLAWSIPYMEHWQIDLSVMPRAEGGPRGR